MASPKCEVFFFIRMACFAPLLYLGLLALLSSEDWLDQYSDELFGGGGETR